MTHSREENLISSMTQTSWRFFAWLGFLASVILLGLTAYIHQFRTGLIVTGMRDQISWGLYITNFVFFIGISHAGTLISAILRVTNTGWRRPITRMAEAVTVFALCIGAPMVIIDMGRPDRLWHVFAYGRIQSPILWDVMGVSTYLTGCVLYFYIPMIPDVALLAGREELPLWRRRLYRALSLNWKGTEPQQALLERSISIMAIFIIPLAVSVHTVVSWIFAMTLRPGWDSSIFGPYFVVGAIYSGAAAVIFSMYVLRRVYRLENYIEPFHFRKLGLLLLAFCLLYLYFNINEYLTAGYKLRASERPLVERLFTGDYAWLFWTSQVTCVFLPLVIMLLILAVKHLQRFVMPGMALASALVIVGAWLKRYVIVVPTLRSPFLPSGQGLPWDWTFYRPTWVEWSITAAAVAGFLLIYTLLSKLFPIVSIWETREDEVQQTQAATAKVEQSPLRPWKAGAVFTGIVFTLVLLFGAVAHAAPSKPKTPAPTSLSLEWKLLPPLSAQQAEAAAAAEQKSAVRESESSGAQRIFNPFAIGSQPPQAQEPIRPVELTATLKDANNVPIAYKSVEFSLQTDFGKLSFGARPTLVGGQVKLVIRDRRYGTYPVTALFKGDDDYSAATTTVFINFGEKPAPSLPRVGMLISPYATPAIALPFIAFYGVMWIAFFYAFGYLILWKMRRT